MILLCTNWPFEKVRWHIGSWIHLILKSLQFSQWIYESFPFYLSTQFLLYSRALWGWPFHVLLQMKSVPKGRIVSLCSTACYSPGENISETQLWCSSRDNDRLLFEWHPCFGSWGHSVWWYKNPRSLLLTSLGVKHPKPQAKAKINEPAVFLMTLKLR